MKWALRQRLDFIRQCLERQGQVNRADLVRQFEISRVQASIDLQRFLKLHPGAMTYDASRKAYMRGKPLPPDDDPPPRTADGYAVIKDGAIIVETVSPTPLAAQVNGLGVLFGIQVGRDTPDAVVEAAWQEFGRHTGARIERVMITEFPADA